MDERKMRRYPPIIVSMAVAVIFTLAAIGTLESRAAQAPAFLPPITMQPEEPPSVTDKLQAQAPVTEATVVEAEQMAAPATAEPEKAYTYYDVPLDDGLQEYAQDLCEEYDFPYYDIIVAMIGHESSYRETVVSQTNDYGYMQINACNHDWLREELGVTDMLDGQQNILSGIYILQGLYHKYDDIGLALMAYNCGEYGAELLWEDGVFSTNYSRSIQQEAAELTVRKG